MTLISQREGPLSRSPRGYLKLHGYLEYMSGWRHHKTVMSLPPKVVTNFAGKETRSRYILLVLLWNRWRPESELVQAYVPQHDEESHSRSWHRESRNNPNRQSRGGRSRPSPQYLHHCCCTALYRHPNNESLETNASLCLENYFRNLYQEFAALIQKVYAEHKEIWSGRYVLQFALTLLTFISIIWKQIDRTTNAICGCQTVFSQELGVRDPQTPTHFANSSRCTFAPPIFGIVGDILGGHPPTGGATHCPSYPVLPKYTCT